MNAYRLPFFLENTISKMDYDDWGNEKRANIDWVPTVVWETCLHNLIYLQTCEIVIILSYSIFDISTLINLGRAKPIEVVRRCMF